MRIIQIFFYTIFIVMEHPNTNFKMLNMLLSNTTNSQITMFGNLPMSMQENQVPTTSFLSRQSKKRHRKHQKKVTFAEYHNQPATKDSFVGTAPDDLAETLFVDDCTNVKWDDSQMIETIPFETKNICNTSISTCCNVKAHPIILKKRDQPYPEPIKNLPFSPSRFLNPDTNSSQSEKEKVTRDLNLSLCSHPDDSGIETSVENDLMFAKALTSTPICKKSRKRLITPLKSEIDAVSPLKFSHLSESCFSEANTTLLKYNEHTSNDSGNETVFKTPVIRKYLNESGPRTPTPFKCEGKASEKDMGKTSNIGTFSPERFNLFNDDKPLPMIGKLSPEVTKLGTLSQRVHPRSLKKARKALLLDQEWSVHESKPLGVMGVQDDISLASRLPDVNKVDHVGFIPFESPMSRSKIRVRNCSSLVDDGTVVESQKFKIGRKSFYTSHSEIVSRKEEVCKKWKSSIELNKKWVAIACGHSEDQKSMTLAAKNYLRYSEHNPKTLSEAVLKKKFCRSTLMR
ncbi:uncharacterized protein LOC120329326 isoform X1 [Styela clava]